MVYTREAHPVDGWDIGNENRVYNPQTIEERRQVAGMCEVALQYGVRTYVDEMDDAVMTAYAAWPERLYLIGRDGRVLYLLTKQLLLDALNTYVCDGVDVSGNTSGRYLSRTI